MVRGVRGVTGGRWRRRRAASPHGQLLDGRRDAWPPRRVRPRPSARAVPRLAPGARPASAGARPRSGRHGMVAAAWSTRPRRPTTRPRVGRARRRRGVHPAPTLGGRPARRRATSASRARASRSCDARARACRCAGWRARASRSAREVRTNATIGRTIEASRPRRPATASPSRTSDRLVHDSPIGRRGRASQTTSGSQRAFAPDGLGGRRLRPLGRGGRGHVIGVRQRPLEERRLAGVEPELHARAAATMYACPTSSVSHMRPAGPPGARRDQRVEPRSRPGSPAVFSA